ncbi:hypothetical protein O2W18_01020 [Modestobacter sp. VKM Ac-2983]|uniref:hypothetical protein n=1 Tax=Modestobacter sp. VKM Ac-2983 TaxID=3004137 RepID=UPI0022ABA55C|nr:hypothetical protein [Modestobacter sp. VKM Ac-2983]MCZ2803681.1 hypothetical protein [Modestobacter sp. VKM Ac-2983]
MDLTLVGRAVRENRALVALGVLLAVVAGLFAGYSVTSSGLEPRTPPVYEGRSTILLSNPSLSVYAAQLGGTTDADPAAAPEDADLTALAMVYAWIVTGDEIRDRTEEAVGEFGPDESLTALLRTTQPAGDERFGSNADLPIFDIVSTATSEERAEEMAAAATDEFLAYVDAQQDAAEIPEDRRVDVSVLRTASATLVDGGSSLVSAVLVGAVVLFVVLLLVVYRTNARMVRSRRATRGGADGSAARGAHRSDAEVPATDQGAWAEDDHRALARSTSE